MEKFWELIKARRSRYALTDESPVSDEEITNVIKECIQVAPSAFNSQGARVLVLFGKRHQEFWNLTKAELKKIVPAEQFVPTEQKLKSFAAAHGTVLYFEEWKTVEKLQAQFPTYKDNFPVWAYQANAMLEYEIWVALAGLGLGASLQHYNPVVDEAVRKAFQVPQSWKLIAQMPFGEPSAPADFKTVLPVQERMKILR